VPAPEEYDDPAALAQYAAVNLFVTRSRAVNPNFTLNAGNAAAIAGLCARLDGLPLAIELAAARSKLFSPQAMLARLGDQLTFFTDQRLPPRQRTLRATLDWSYALLGAAEQRLLARLAIFTGRFELEAAEAVCAIDGDIDVFSGLAALLDHSLVQRVEETAGAAVSLRLLSTVQQYARSGLPAAEADRIRDQHLHYYAGLVEAGYIGLTGGAQSDWLTHLSAADENIQAALTWALRDDAPPALWTVGATIAAQLGRYWEMRGRLSEGWAWLEQARSRQAHLPGIVHLRLLNQTASLAQMLGRLDAAQAVLEEALVLSQQVDAPRLRGVTLHLLGLSAGRAGDLDRADALLSECLALYRRTPEITSTDMSALLNNLAIVTTRRGDYARTQTLLTEGLEMAQRRGDVFSTAHILSSLGDLAQRQGDLAAAGRRHRESLRLRQTLDNRTGMLTSLQNLANLALACGDLPLAARLCAASDALRQTHAVQLTGHMADDFRTNVATLRTELGKDEFARLWASGGALTLDEAARLALQI
jgi:tetratricopeptide (TPR) repeat protein